MHALNSPNENSETFAAIDLGSNSFHMIVCRYSNGKLSVEDKLREMVRLGAGLDKKCNLDDDTQARALACLERFGQRLRGLPAHHIRIAGTNTLRIARNAAQFIARAERALGHSIEIIAGTEEARLIYLGVAHSTGADERQRFVMDIGGGSTELIIGQGFQPRYMQSLYMGCVSITRGYFSDGTISAKAMKRAELAAQVELAPVKTTYRKMGWEKAIGASGSIRAIRKVVQSEGWCDEGISLDSLKSLRDALLDVGHIDDLRFKGLSEERAPVFVGGVIVLLATFKALGLKHLQVSDGALREGLIHDLLGRVQHEDVRSLAVNNLAQRYHVDLAHAQLVAKTAQACAEQVSEGWGLDKQDSQRWLGWAAQLHEIGLDIAHSSFHKHGAYIAEFTDLSGFSRNKQRLLATLIRTHRRKLSATAFDHLTEKHRHNARHWAILLRLAVLLHRSRSPEALPKIKLKATENRLKMKFPEGWLDEHLLTQADLSQEVEYLRAAGFDLSYS